MVNLLNLKTARYSVDGKPAGEWIPGQPIVVPAGAHVVEFTNPNCLSRRIAVTAETQDLGDVRLAWAPARLLVTTTPPSTALRVTAGRVSHPAASGTEMQLSVSKESPDGRLHATIYATTEGYSSRSEEVDLIAGVLTRKTIVLQPAR